MFLAHQPSTAASMPVKGRHRSGKGVDHQHHLNTAEAAGTRHQDVVTTNLEPPQPSNASQTLFRTQEMLANLQAGAMEVEDDQVTKERPEEINGEATEKMEATTTSIWDTTMLFQKT